MTKIKEVIAMLEAKPQLAWLAWEAKNLRRFAKVQELDIDEFQIPTGSSIKHSLADTVENIEHSIISLGILADFEEEDPDEYGYWEALDAIDIDLDRVDGVQVFRFSV